MARKITPHFIFETSWEVCNMVGGIYTVLSTRAKELYDKVEDNLIFIGPDVWKEQESPYFEEDKKLLVEWKENINSTTDINVRVGRWKIPNNPIAILVQFDLLFAQKNEIYGRMWELYRVDSLHAYGDYDEASMFGYASGMVIESFYQFYQLKKSDNVVAHFNEWMTTFGAFYIQNKVPNIATLFTTHATSIGRSIAGNNKPLYNYMSAYNGDQMAEELNMQAKHSTEKTGANVVDCFTTVSNITGIECEELLDKKPHIITPNGFEDDFVPKGTAFTEKQKKAKEKLKEVAQSVLGYELDKNAFFVGTAGRYEYKNKGLDVLIEALSKLSNNAENSREVVAFIMTPAHSKEARKDVIEKMTHKEANVNSWNCYTTHELYDYEGDNIISALRWFQLKNAKEQKVKVIFVPTYLNGSDGIFNLSYWDLLIGMDLTVFPSYYEPWGYTPLESVAFSVPTITTNLSGFGQWTEELKNKQCGVQVVPRSDYNYSEVTTEIANRIFHYIKIPRKEMTVCRKNALEISKKALWSNFIKYYYEAYDIALKNRNNRTKKLR